MEKHTYILLGQIDSFSAERMTELEGKTFDYIEDIDGYDGLEIQKLTDFLEDLNIAIYPQEYFVTYIYLKHKTDKWQI